MNSTGERPNYIRHTYKVTNELKSYTVYGIVDIQRGKNLLTDIIRIEQFQGKSLTTRVDDYLRLRTDLKSWERSKLITGLRPTSNKSLFSGDSKPIDKSTAKTLLMFVFSEDRQTLFIDVYRGFYPKHKEIHQNIINTY